MRPKTSLSSAPAATRAPLRTIRRPLALAVVTALVSSIVATGCGKSDDKKVATQVAAKVNKEEVSVHQINYVLSRAGQIPQDKAEEAKKQALERLVEQELLVQQAVETKLDRNPNVMQALDAARREILARAYLDQAASAAPKPTPDQVSAYYTKHPELFAERKIYRLRELSIAANPEIIAQAKAEAAKTSNLEELVAWAKARNISFRPEQGVKPAEQLPLEHLPALHKLKDGQTLAIDVPGGLLVVQVLATQSQPVDAKAAAPMIEQYLQLDGRKQLATTELKRLRDAAKIEYVGDFAAASAAKAPAAATPAAAAPAPAAAAGQGADAEAINKGLKGLK